jgi:hypothetical protein
MGMFDEITFSKNIIRSNALMEKYDLHIEDFVFQTKCFTDPSLTHYRFININDIPVLHEETDKNGLLLEPENIDHRILYEKRFFEKCHLDEIVIEGKNYMRCYEALQWKGTKITKWDSSEYKNAGNIWFDIKLTDGIISDIRGFIDIMDREKDIHERSIIIPQADALEWLAPFQYI